MEYLQQVLQGAESLLMILPLLLICFLMPLLQKRMGKGGGGGGPVATDTWFFKSGIEDAYNTVAKSVEPWTIEQPAAAQGKTLFGDRTSARFRVVESVSPRLYKLVSGKEGQVTFEFTEVQGGGASVRASYSPQADRRVQMLRAELPIQDAGMKGCKNCGRLLLTEFVHCPYCGQKQE